MAWEDADKFWPNLCVPIDETTAEPHLRHHFQDWRLRRTPKLLRLKLHCIWTWRFFFIFYFVLCYFIYIDMYFLFHLLIFYFYSYLYSFYFLFSIPSLSNAFSNYGWLVSSLSLFISLKLFLFVSLFCFFLSTSLFVFPFSFNFFAFHPLSPFHSKYHQCYYYKKENT
jgi:hypothetical protein